jgi:hypothetical protein
MTTKPKKLVVDLATGKQEYIDLTPDEINERELAGIEAATRREEEEAAAAALAALKASAKAKLIAGQALTEEEAATIVL